MLYRILHIIGYFIASFIEPFLESTFDQYRVISGLIHPEIGVFTKQPKHTNLALPRYPPRITSPIWVPPGLPEWAPFQDPWNTPFWEGSPSEKVEKLTTRIIRSLGH